MPVCIFVHAAHFQRLFDPRRGVDLLKAQLRMGVQVASQSA
jgi:hypothetical protein